MISEPITSRAAAFLFFALLVSVGSAALWLLMKYADRVDERRHKRRCEEVTAALKVFCTVNKAVGGDLTYEEFGQAQRHLEQKYHLGGKDGVIVFRKSDAGQTAKFILDEVRRRRQWLGRN